MEEFVAPAINAHGCEVQLVLALKEEHFCSDLHNGWRLDGHSNGEQRQLRFVTGPVVSLAMEVLQSPLKLQSLVWIKRNMRRVTLGDFKGLSMKKFLDMASDI